MKPSIKALLLAIILSHSLQAVQAQSDELKFGIETVTGVRGSYNYRGFELADSTFDFQLETEVTINDNTFLNLGAWYATETGEGDFNESAIYARLRSTRSDSLDLGISTTYRDVDQGSERILSTRIRDGLEIGTFATWYFNDNLSSTAGVYYDSGATGLYSNIELSYSQVISEKSFFSIKAGVSYVDGYYDRNGLNDAYARISVTYHISDTVSIAPFAGTSILLDNDDAGDDTNYLGLWFEVSF